MSSWLLFSYYSFLVLPYQPRQGPMWSIVILQFTVLTVFQFLDACCDGSAEFTCQDGRICCNELAATMPFPPKVCVRVEETDRLGFWTGNPFVSCSVVAMKRSAEV